MTAMAARQKLDDGGGFAMPPHSQHDAFVGPFHGADGTGLRRRTQPSHVRHSGMVRRAGPGLSRFRVRCSASPRNDDHYALTQPTASPVKERYSPAAVSRHETISMP